MQDSNSKYDLRELISEDSRTKTYRAWDNELSRLVICVCLKKRVGEKGAREFLLHARMLGQLKHPGLLPIHDMGFIKSSYFYCYRPAPGKTLLAILKGESKDHQLEAKSKQLILMLNQVADTIAYLHQQGVTLGKLDLETVSIGRYGEVIITDWTKSKKHDPQREREQLNVRIQDDLKLLSSLGLSMWFLTPKYMNLTIREWDSVARNLPLELQIIFDRAHLSRGGIYKNAREFQLDVNNYFIGRAPRSESNDISFYLKGKFHSHRKAFFLSFALIIGCTLTLISQINPLAKLQDELEDIDLKQEVETVELSPISEELKLLKETFRRDQEEFKRLQDRHHVLNDRTKESKNETATLNQKKQKLEKELELKEKSFEKLKSRRRTLINTKEDLSKKVALSRIENPDTKIDLPKIGWIDLSEILQSKHAFRSKSISSLRNFAKTLDAEDSWFHEYLINTKLNPNLVEKINFEYAQSDYHISSDGQKVVWSGDSSLIILKLIEEPSWQVIHLDGRQVRSIAFESSSDYLQVLSKKQQVYRVNISLRTPGWSRAYPWTLPFKSLLPYSPSNNFQFRSFNKPQGFRFSSLVESDEDLPSIFDVEEKELSSKIDDMLVSKQGLIFRVIDNALYSSLNGTHYMDLPKNRVKVDFSPNDKSIYLYTNDYIEVFHPAPNSFALGGNVMSQKNKLLSLGRWSFPKDVDPLNVLATPDSSAFWIQFNDGRIFKWEISSLKGIYHPNIIGSPILSNLHKLLTIDGPNLHHYQLTPRNISEIFPNGLDQDNELESDFSLNNDQIIFGQTIGKTWSLEDDPYYLSISDGDIEVWHRLKRTKIAVIAHNPRPLRKVAYSNIDKKIYALDERGELLIY